MDQTTLDINAFICLATREDDNGNTDIRRIFDITTASPEGTIDPFCVWGFAYLTDDLIAGSFTVGALLCNPEGQVVARTKPIQCNGAGYKGRRRLLIDVQFPALHIDCEGPYEIQIHLNDNRVKCLPLTVRLHSGSQ